MSKNDAYISVDKPSSLRRRGPNKRGAKQGEIGQIFAKRDSQDINNVEMPYWLISDNLGREESERPYWGLSADNIQDWGRRWGTFFFYTVLLMLGYATYVFFSGYIFSYLPITNSANNFPRAFAMALLHTVLIFSSFGEITTAITNPFVGILVEVVHVIWSGFKNVTLYNLLRLLWYLAMTFLAAAVGALGFGMWPNYEAPWTSDCTLDPKVACDALPFLNGVNAEPSYGMVIITTLLEAAVFIVPVWMMTFDDMERYSDDAVRVRMRRKYIQLTAALAFPIYFMIYFVASPFLGNVTSIWYYLWIAIFTNDFSNASVYTWPALLGAIIAFIAVFLYEVFRRNQINSNM